MQHDCRLTQWGLLAVTGAEARAFLQGQLTCDLSELTQETPKLGGYANIQGRLESIFFALAPNDTDVLLFLPKSILTHTKECLAKYAVFSAVTLSDVSDEWLCIGHTAAPSEAPLTQETDDQAYYLLPTTPPTAVTLARAVPSGSFLEDEAYFLQAMLQANIPVLSEKSTGYFLAHPINLPRLGGVSFSKGCYLGQEIIARMEYRSKQKKTTAQLSGFAETPEPKSKVFSGGKSVGEVVYSAYDEEANVHIALTEVPIAALDKGSFQTEDGQALTMLSFVAVDAETK